MIFREVMKLRKQESYNISDTSQGIAMQAKANRKLDCLKKFFNNLKFTFLGKLISFSEAKEIRYKTIATASPRY